MINGRILKSIGLQLGLVLSFLMLILFYFFIQSTIQHPEDWIEASGDSEWLSWNSTDTNNATTVDEEKYLTCSGSPMLQSDRDLIVHIHNKLRRNMASGLDKNVESTARNMYKMKWDCDLERTAFKYSQTCPRQFLDQEVLNSNSHLFKFFYSRSDGRNQTDHISTALYSWWNQAERGNASNKYSGRSNYYNWANMAKGKTYKIGCSYNDCPDGRSSLFTCLYNEKAQIERETIYEVGSPCVLDEDCTTYPKSKCSVEDGLCEAPYVSEDDNTSAICDSDKMSDKNRMWALDLHNFYRSRLARGLEWNGESNSSQPKAKRMLKMEYDCNLETFAQKWADNCVFAHSNLKDRKNQGQNLYMTSFRFLDPYSLLHQAIEKWWKELAEFGMPLHNVLTSEVWSEKGKAIGHYTQMAWERTYRMGCAVTNCPTMSYIVCHYGPAGNRKNELVYEIGEPCRNDDECPTGTYCDYEAALCSMYKFDSAYNLLNS